MDSKTKKTGRLRRFALRVLGPSVSKRVICRILRKKISNAPALLPEGLNRNSEILFILPADRVEMIFQLENLFAILGRYKDSNLTFLCPAAHTSFVSGLKNVRVIKFDPAEFMLYSVEFNRVALDLSTKSFDICILLEKRYTLAHLYIMGMSHAHLRVGWGGDDGFPFMNIRLLEAPSEGKTLWERNLEVAKILDADSESKVRWGVQKSTAEEVSQLLKEHKLKKEPALICVDAASLEAECGKEWCAELMRSLKGSGAGNFYIFGGGAEKEKQAPAEKVAVAAGADKDKPAGAEGEKPAPAEAEKPVAKDSIFPVLPSLSIPKTAALMACTDVVVTAAGPLLGLAQISSAKIVPVVTKEQSELYCRASVKIMPVLFAGKPGNGESGAVQRNIKELIKKAKAEAASS
ncbi:MAG: hypothetical protein FWB94_07675 [Chitinispirillia bacterium]|nr:hypothetical protein [Chitinispirillia bacterium]